MGPQAQLQTQMGSGSKVNDILAGFREGGSGFHYWICTGSDHMGGDIGDDHFCSQTQVQVGYKPSLPSLKPNQRPNPDLSELGREIMIFIPEGITGKRNRKPLIRIAGLGNKNLPV